MTATKANVTRDVSAQSSSIWAFELRRNEAQRAATREAVSFGAALTGRYLAMNSAAVLIASFGLLQNSPAVIIGAMLIAMLYGPIIGIALGLAESSLALLNSALVSEMVGAAVVWIISYAIGWASRGIPISSEILSRTSPNLLDLLIALVGGFAGGFTYLSPGLTGVIAGVAIATALVPPLASCGILLAHRLPELAVGALLLFLANLTAIALGAMSVFWLSGHRQPTRNETHSVFIARLVSFLLFATLCVHLSFVLNRMIAQSAQENAIRKTLSDEVTRVRGARFVTVTLVQRSGATEAWAVVRTPQPFSPEQVGELNDRINRITGTAVVLYIRSVITAETSRTGYDYEPKMLPNEER
jgi:uncharacterized hydrophobic protein (TIGR00271 family)